MVATNESLRLREVLSRESNTSEDLIFFVPICGVVRLVQQRCPFLGIASANESKDFLITIQTHITPKQKATCLSTGRFRYCEVVDYLLYSFIIEMRLRTLFE